MVGQSGLRLEARSIVSDRFQELGLPNSPQASILYTRMFAVIIDTSHIGKYYRASYMGSPPLNAHTEPALARRLQAASRRRPWAIGRMAR